MQDMHNIYTESIDTQNVVANLSLQQSFMIASYRVFPLIVISRVFSFVPKIWVGRAR